jgi:hypothetical protein
MPEVKWQNDQLSDVQLLLTEANELWTAQCFSGSKDERTHAISTLLDRALDEIGRVRAMLPA